MESGEKEKLEFPAGLCATPALQPSLWLDPLAPFSSFPLHIFSSLTL
jgi:hypothetical protein